MGDSAGNWQLGRGREILETVADYFYFEDISDKLLAYCESRCESFQGPAHAQEQSLLNTDIFTAFCELFTGLIEGFLEESGIRISDFYAAVRNELDSVRGRASFSNIVMSTVDYLHFCDMMNEVRQGKGFAFVPPLLGDDDDDGAQGSRGAGSMAAPAGGEMDAYDSHGRNHTQGQGHAQAYGRHHQAPAEGKYDDDDGGTAMDVSSRPGDKDQGEAKRHHK